MSQLDSLVLLQETAVIDWSRPFVRLRRTLGFSFFNFIDESRFSYCHLRADSDCRLAELFTFNFILYTFHLSRSSASRRSEPSSRTTLIGEQPNPWDLLQPRDVLSRHRGAELRRRYGLLGGTSLLSPE